MTFWDGCFRPNGLCLGLAICRWRLFAAMNITSLPPATSHSFVARVLRCFLRFPVPAFQFRMLGSCHQRRRLPLRRLVLWKFSCPFGATKQAILASSSRCQVGASIFLHFEAPVPRCHARGKAYPRLGRT